MAGSDGKNLTRAAAGLFYLVGRMVKRVLLYFEGSKMRQSSSPLVYIVAAVMVIIGCDKEIKDFDFAQYEKASALHFSIKTDKSAKETIPIKTLSGINAILIVGASISIKFADEENERQIWSYTDYVFPSEIKLDQNKGIIYAKVSGFGPSLSLEWQKEQKIIIYDLSGKKVDGWVKVK